MFFIPFYVLSCITLYGVHVVTDLLLCKCLCFWGSVASERCVESFVPCLDCVVVGAILVSLFQ